ncbi:hypothetical protein MUN84_09720 [Hymenobacter sp. 5516J-16]|nr:hypothetical protein [Hymenobacter sp. 5516J-16]UOQ78779.1 hypothetical protein MUN84_09720 [Hymenobacter sp. 5516J-16]
MQNQYKDLTKAKEYYQRCIVFAESTNDTKQGFYLYSLLNLGRISDKQKDVAAATRYYKEVQQKAERKSEAFNEARAYLKKKRK